MKRQIPLFCLLLLCVFAYKVDAQTISCNNHVNISVNGSCNIDLSVDAFMEGASSDSDVQAGLYEYDILFNGQVLMTGNQNGPLNGGNVDMSPFIGQTLQFNVRYTPRGNFCWGTVLLEDKIAPQINCDCPVGGLGGGNYDADCTLSCVELPLVRDQFWNPLQNAIINNDPNDVLALDVTDNCNNFSASDLSYSDQVFDLGNCDGSVLRRTWNVNGSRGPIATCVKEYYFRPLKVSEAMEATFTSVGGTDVPDVIQDKLVLPKRIVNIPSCGVGNSPAEIAAYFDNPQTVDQDTDGDNITPADLDIDLVIENNEGYWYGFPHYYVLGRAPMGYHAQAVDNSICTINTGYTDLETEACAPGCSGNSKTIRTWSILDWCTGELITYDQIIKIVDQDGPSITVADITTSVDPWECEATVHLPSPEHLFDNCDNILSYSVSSVNGYQITGNSLQGYVANGVAVGESMFQYSAVDCCNNESRVNIRIVVRDNTPPVAVTKERLVTSLTSVGTPNNAEYGISKIFAIEFDNGSYDGCSEVTIEIRRPNDFYCEPNDTLWGDFVKFCCEDLNGQEFVEIPVEMRVSDLGGNSNISWSIVRLEDKALPNVFCPEPLILTCDMDYNNLEMTGLPEGFSPCGEFNFNIDPVRIMEDTEPQRKLAGTLPLYDVDGDGDFDDVPPYDQSCGFGALRREFRNADNVNFCTQWIVIERTGDFDATTIEFPDDVVLDCNDYDEGEPTWLNDNACNLIGVSVDIDTFFQERGSCMTIVKNWTVIDWCLQDPTDPDQGKYTDVQVIQINDTEDPELTVVDSLIYSVDANCVSKGIVLQASADDDGICSSDWIGWEVSIDLNADWTQDYYYANTIPAIINGEPNPFYVEKTANGEQVEIVLPDNLPSSKVWHRVVWRATDGCNNNRSHTRYFQISDAKAPTPYCYNLSTAFMQNGQVELWAKDFSLGSFDNCTSEDDLLFTFTDVVPPVRDDSQYDPSPSGNNPAPDPWYDGTYWYYDANDGSYADQAEYGSDIHLWNEGSRTSGKIFTGDEIDANGFTSVKVYVWDECENIDFCTVNLRVVDNDGGGSVSGRIATEQGEGISGIKTELVASLPGYPLEDTTDGQGYYAFENTPYNIDYSLRAVSANDNYLNGVSTLDLVLIQKHILGQQFFRSPYKMIAADANSDDFVTAIDLIELRKLILGVYDELPESDSWKFVNNNEELSMSNPWAYRESNDIVTMSSDMINQDFVAVKIGDVSGNVQLSLSDQQIESRSQSFLEYDERNISAGETVSIEFSVSAKDVQGAQLALQLKGLDVLSVDGLHEGEYLITDNLFKVAAANVNEKFAFTLTVISSQTSATSDLIGLDKLSLAPEIYKGENLETIDLNLRAKGDTGFSLDQNTPNPFSDNTIIGFSLSEAQNIELSFYNVDGKLLHTMRSNANAGYNALSVSAGDLQAEGLVYYKLKTKEHTATKQMVLLR